MVAECLKQAQTPMVKEEPIDQSEEEVQPAGPARPTLPSLEDQEACLSEDPATGGEPAPKVMKVDESSWLDDIVCVKVEPPKYSPRDICLKEVNRYIEEEGQIGQQENPLNWWKQKEQFFPHVALVARDILAIPASSVPAERIFSLAGLIVTKGTQLSAENVDMLIALNKNMKD